MPSTSPSENWILKLEDASLSFRPTLFRATSWRDLFTRNNGAERAAEPIPIARSLNLTIRRSERVGLLGINGTGKTSLCRMIAGMFRPDSGKILLRGESRAVFNTMVGIQPELTGRENAALLAEFLFPTHPGKTSLVEEALEFSELARLLDMPFKHYSNGMQARLCLSLVSATPSDLLILDEVFDGADSFFREKIAARVLKLIETSGSVIFVSHSPEQIEQACNRVIILHRGNIVFDGPVAEGLRSYRELGRLAR